MESVCNPELSAVYASGGESHSISAVEIPVAALVVDWGTGYIYLVNSLCLPVVSFTLYALVAAGYKRCVRLSFSHGKMVRAIGYSYLSRSSDLYVCASEVQATVTLRTQDKDGTKTATIHLAY